MGNINKNKGILHGTEWCSGSDDELKRFARSILFNTPLRDALDWYTKVTEIGLVEHPQQRFLFMS